MRLIHVQTRELCEFAVATPPYAILSHTWTDEEIDYQTFLSTSLDEVRNKRGSRKIEYLCAQAARDGLDYVWIDTACIDKTSSAELSESINSMLQYYQDAQVCYAFLDDVDMVDGCVQHLSEAKWFSRGWTLQELLVPSEMRFYGRGWALLGSRSDLCDHISLITKIDRLALTSRGAYRTFNIATRMLWAASRETTRPEDLAYSLLGLFDVNMSPIYGEGATKAFLRLQAEIIRMSNDDSILAWEYDTRNYPNCLAATPFYFKHNRIVSWTPSQAHHHDLTSQGLHVRMRVLVERQAEGASTDREMTWGILNCRYEQNLDGYIALNLYATGIDQIYRRHEPFKLSVISEEKAKAAQWRSIYLLTDTKRVRHVHSAPMLRSICMLELDGLRKYGIELTYLASENARQSFNRVTLVSEIMYLRHDRERMTRCFRFANQEESIVFAVMLINTESGNEEFHFASEGQSEKLVAGLCDPGETRFRNGESRKWSKIVLNRTILAMSVALSRQLRCDIWTWVLSISVRPLGWSFGHDT